MHASSTSNELGIFKIEEAFALNRREPLQLSFDSSSAAVASFFLRRNGRADLSRGVLALQPENSEFGLLLERVRTHFSQGDLIRAKAELGKIRPKGSLESAEIALEKCRLATAENRHSEAIQEATLALELPEVQPWTRMTLYQVRAHSCLELRDLAGARRDLWDARSIADLFPLMSTTISILRFMVKVEVLDGQFIAAENHLKLLLSIFSELPLTERWIDWRLTALRAEADFFASVNQGSRRTQALQEGIEISRWIGDRVTQKKCEDELRDTLSATYSQPSPELQVLSRPSWSYLPRFALILRHSPKAFHTLEDSPVTRSLLEELLRHDCLPNSEIFQRVWKLKFNKERHDSHLRNALSKLRKVLPKGALIQTDSQVRLLSKE
jgi:hypothetical protein